MCWRASSEQYKSASHTRILETVESRMTAYLQTEQTQFELTGVKVVVPDDDTARLMYYLSCVCTIIDCADDPDIQRFTSYLYYHRLSLDERKALIALCYIISPDVLNNKVFFQSDALCGEFSNEFYTIHQVRNQILAAESVVIAGRTRQVHQIMTYKWRWMQLNYHDPMRRLAAVFNNSPSTAVTYTRSNTNTRPIVYTQPTIVRSRDSNKSKYICCGICCFLFCILPTIIGIIIGIINSKK